MGLVNPSQSSPGDTIEAADINTPVNQLAAVINGSIETANLADNAVTTAKLADGAVTAAKIDFGGSGTGVWWQEIGRTTLVSAGDSISVTGLPARKYLMIVASVLASGAIDAFLQFNNDTATNYSYRFDLNNGTVSSATSVNKIAINPTGNAETKLFTLHILNIAGQEKMVIGQTSETGTSGAGNLPSRAEYTGKWANTSAQISRIDFINNGLGDFAIGSEVIVLGHN